MTMSCGAFFKKKLLRIPAHSCFPWAMLLLAAALVPSSGWASTTNCPVEPAQNVPMASGVTYYGSNCVLSTASDEDTFQFKAAAGDTWSMVVGLGAAPPVNICMRLYAPGNTTAVFSGCTTLNERADAVATNQALTVAGVYTIVVTEVSTAVVSYALSLERLSPAPTDGAPLVLGKTINSAVSAPTAQDAFTVYGGTPGVYQVSVSLAAGQGNNVCFGVYQPGGTNVLAGGALCTVVNEGIDAVQANATPTQDGTLVVIVYEGGNPSLASGTDDGTVSYNLSVSCAPGATCPTPPTKCVLTDSATYDAATSTVTMNFTIGTPYPVTWNAWLTYQNTLLSLWSQAQPITEPQVAVVKMQTGVPVSGEVGILSTFTYPTAGITCTSIEFINTGKP